MPINQAEPIERYAPDCEVIRMPLTALSGAERSQLVQAATIHELRNMLSAIESGFNLLDNASGKANSAMIWQGMRRASVASQQLASRLLAEQRARARTRIDLREALGRLSALLRPHLPEGVQLSVRTWLGLPPIIADPTEFQAVLVHMVENAVDALPDGGIVTVDARPSRGQVLLAVADNGTGMSPHDLDRAASPFHTTKQGKSVGLGLMQVRRFAAQQRGRLTVRSAPGKGSVFVLRLPGRPGIRD